MANEADGLYRKEMMQYDQCSKAELYVERLMAAYARTIKT